MTKPAVKRNVAFILLSVAAFVLKTQYSGPFAEAIHSWGGNVSASFAVYFVFASSVLGRGRGRLVSATAALLVVQLFEVTNGFGVMTNVYDLIDFAANLVGVGIAAGTDIGASTLARRRSERRASEAGEKPTAGAAPNGSPARQPGNSGMTEKSSSVN